MLCYLAHEVNCDVIRQEGPLVRRGQNNVARQATINKVLGITNDVLLYFANHLQASQSAYTKSAIHLVVDLILFFFF